MNQTNLEKLKKSQDITSTKVEGYQVLVVDDSLDFQLLLKAYLSELSEIVRIDFAVSGEMALEKVKNLYYDLIFLDVMMPNGINGYETCTKLREIVEYKKTPIIMVSGKISPLDEVNGVMAGCTAYLKKPIEKDNFQEVSNRVLAWLEKH